MSTVASGWGAQPTTGSRGHKWWTLVAMCFGLFMALLDVTIVNVALPTIRRSLNASLSDLEWIVNAYVLALAVFIVTAGRLGDIFGRKRMFIVGLGIFTLGSLLCALAGDITIGSLSHATVLHIARAFQGLGGAFIFPLSLAIISVAFHGKERGAAIGIWGGVSGLATAIGPLVGGVLVDKVSWQSIFYINVPIGILAIAVTLWAVRESRDERAPRRIDFFGLITITVALFCLVLALIDGNDHGWTSAPIIALFAVAAVFLVIFVVGELRLKNPMVDPRLFAIPSFTGAAIAGFCLSAGMFSLFFFLALYMQNTLGFSALDAGLRFLPLTIGTFFISPVSGRLTDKIGARPLLTAGLAVLAVAVLLMARITPSDTANDWTVLLPGLILGGIGMGLTLPPIPTVAVGTVPRNRAGMASGTNSMCRQVGNALGIAFLGAILSHQTSSYIAGNIRNSTFPPGLGFLKERLANTVGSGASTGSFAPPSGVRQDPRVAAIVAHATKAAFVQGLVDILHVAAIILAVGAVFSFLLIRRSDMEHEQAPAEQRAEQAAEQGAPLPTPA